MKVTLRLDVDVFDARNIIKWLRNKDVTQYLNEDENNALVLEHLINIGQAGLLTYHMNQNSRFFLLDNEDEKCLGFITLFTIKEKQEYEVVIAIGEPENWGKQIGYHALKTIMNKVFFEWRINKLVAKIYVDNQRSIRLFGHLGFTGERLNGSYILFSITFDEYLKHLKNSK